MFNEKTHYKWPFSIAFCMFTRGYVSQLRDHCHSFEYELETTIVGKSCAMDGLHLVVFKNNQSVLGSHQAWLGRYPLNSKQ